MASLGQRKAGMADRWAEIEAEEAERTAVELGEFSKLRPAGGPMFLKWGRHGASRDDRLKSRYRADDSYDLRRDGLPFGRHRCREVRA